MAKEIKINKSTKKREPKYEPKVTFNGTFEQMIQISTSGAGATKKIKSSAMIDTEPAICPTCGATGNFIPPSITEGKKLIVRYKCNNGHFFTKIIDLI